MKPILIAVFLFITNVSMAQEDAHTLIDNALASANIQNKKVFVLFHAYWCGWCKKMDANMQDAQVKSFFDSNFIITHLTVKESSSKKTLENPNGDTYMQKYGGAQSGLPFWAILDKNGVMLVNALDRAGKNLG